MPVSKRVDRFTRLIPGILAVLTVCATAVAGGRLEELTFRRPIIEPLVLAILVGMLVRTVIGSSHRIEPGIRFTAKQVLEVAVCLLGATMDVPRLFASGPTLAIGIVALVVSALTAGVIVGRGAGLTPRLAILVACGNAICGNSAITAVAPVIEADREDVAAAIALTAVVGVGLVLTLPLLIKPLGYDDYQYGLLAGLTVYAVPQVLAAAFAVSALSGQVATAVKLGRVLMLGPVVVFFALRSRTAGGGVSISKIIPWFVAGFAVLATLRSIHAIPDIAANAAKLTAGWLTVGAMAGLGLSVDVRAVQRVGVRVVLAVGGSLVTLIVFAVVLIRLLGVR